MSAPEILLAYPLPDNLPAYQTMYPEEQLGLGYLAALLRAAKFNCVIWEPTLGPLPRFIKDWAGKGGRVLGLSPTFQTIKQCLKLAHIAHSGSTDVAVVLGGLQVGPIAERLLAASPEVEVVVEGEAEHLVVDLATRIIERRPLTGCPGVYFRDRNGIVSGTPPVPMTIPLDDLPFPVRLTNRPEPVARLITSRGCSRQCAYCTTPQRGTHYRRWRGRSAENVVAEMRQLRERHGSDTIAIMDDDFLGGGRAARERAKQIATLLRRENPPFHWFSFWSADRLQPHRRGDAKLLGQMRLSGLERTFIGVEFGTDQALRRFQKPTTVAQNIAAIRLGRKVGIVVQIGFIMFHPHSTLPELAQNYRFLAAHGFDHIPIYFFHQLEVHPGTGICDQLKKEDLLDDTDPSGVWSYRFADPLTAKLHENIGHLALSDAVNETGNMIYRIELTRSRLQLSGWDEQRERRLIDPVFNEVRALNRRFFQNVLRLARQEKSMDREVRQYLESSLPQINGKLGRIILSLAERYDSSILVTKEN